MPAIQPPTADSTKVTVPIKPAWPLLIAHAVISVGMTKVYTMKSRASTDQPSKAAQNVRRSLSPSSRNQSNIRFLLVDGAGR
jgi:hypothetical protein